MPTSTPTTTPSQREARVSRRGGAHQHPRIEINPALLPPPPKLARDRAAAQSALEGLAQQTAARRRDLDPLFDLSRMTREQRVAWESELLQAYTHLATTAGGPGAPVTVRALADLTGLGVRVTRYLLTTGGWTLDEVTTGPRPVQLDAATLAENYATVEEVVRLTGAKRSHVYVALRNPGLEIRTITVAGTRYVDRRDLHLLRPMRHPAPHRLYTR